MVILRSTGVGITFLFTGCGCGSCNSGYSFSTCDSGCNGSSCSRPCDSDCDCCSCSIPSLRTDVPSLPFHDRFIPHRFYTGIATGVAVAADLFEFVDPLLVITFPDPPSLYEMYADSATGNVSRNSHEHTFFPLRRQFVFTRGPSRASCYPKRSQMAWGRGGSKPEIKR